MGIDKLLEDVKRFLAERSVPREVRNSKFGCINCLLNGIECEVGSKYAPAKPFKDVFGKSWPTCKNYIYFD